MSKVVKSKQCYLHPPTNTDNMHIHVCLNFVFKKEHTMNWSGIILNCSFIEGKIVLTKSPAKSSPAFLVFMMLQSGASLFVKGGWWLSGRVLNLRP